MITLILPISTRKGFENMRKSLFNLSREVDVRHNILCICFNKDLYLEARNYYVEYNHIGEWLVTYSEKKNLLVALDSLGNKDEYLFLWNENVVLQQGDIQNLYRSYLEYPNAGFITGWLVDKEVPYWVEDIYAEKPKTIKKDNNDNEVDVAYPFCMMTKKKNFEEYYPPRSRNGLGFGLALRRAGFKNFINKQATCRYNVEAQ